MIALIGLLTATPLMLFSSHARPTLRWGGIAGLIWLGWWWVHSYRRGGFNWQGDAACIGALWLVVVGASDPANSQMVLLTGVAFRSISARPRAAYRTAAEFAVASVAGLLTTQFTGGTTAYPGDIVALLLALLLLVVVIQILRGGILKNQQAGEVAEAISRLTAGGSTNETARSICKELRSLSGVDFSDVVVFSAKGESTVVALDAPKSLPVSTGAIVPASRSAYLIERAAGGPWVERWRQRHEDGEYGRSMTRANIQAVSYAPIRYRGSTLGVLVAGSLQSEPSPDVIENLPVIAEFGAAASALLAPDLYADRLLLQRRTEIQKIIAGVDFQPVFQPIVDVESNEVVGYEALIRFTDREPPDSHFSTAWNVGLGPELELATLERAIQVGCQLPAGGWLNVNISPRLLDDPCPLRSVIDQADRPLVLEITEHEVITDYRSVHEALHQLGPVRTAIDDAGAGIANFSHILELNADFVKLDIGLVRGVATDPGRQAMITALSHFARATNCRLIAEGVETTAEAGAVRSLGVELGQGYWYGRPAAVETFRAMSGDHARSSRPLRRPKLAQLAQR